MGADGEESSAVHGSNTRFEGGLGGRATADGEWLVEIQPSAVARDPRDPNRNNHIRFAPTPASHSSGATTASTATTFDPSVLSEESEFPSLAPSATTGAAITLTNKWVTFGGSTEGNIKQKKKKYVPDFPPLQSEGASYKAASASSSSSKGLTVIAHGSGKLKASGSSSNIASSIEQEYLKSTRQSDTALISKTRWMQEGFSTADRIAANSSQTSSEEDSSLAWAIAESLKSMQVKRDREPPSIAPPEKNDPEVFISAKGKSSAYAPLDSEEAYPSLMSCEATATVVPPSVKTKKTTPAASNIASVSGWSTALSAVGLGGPIKKGSKITVVKAKKPAATSVSGKKPSDESSQPPDGKFTESAFSNWTKVGGASDLPEPPVSAFNPPSPPPPPQPEKGNLPATVEITMADFPSLAPQSSSSSSNSAAKAAVVSLPSKPKPKKKEKVEDLLRKIETNTLAAVKKGKA